ncbi:MAG: SMP-30/gluconolactonase/LRE family protein [Lachnospiraceae bacterium]
MNVLYKGLDLGEGCLWDAKRNAVHFVDINDYKIYSYYLDTKDIKSIDTGDYVGCIVLDCDNNLVAGVHDKLIRYNLENGSESVICQLDLPDYMRFNDGKCDQYGNLWIGTMAIEFMVEDLEGLGSLYCIKGASVVAEYKGFTIPNGMAWSQDGTKFYHIDTTCGSVFSYDVVDEFKLLHKETAWYKGDILGSPDGMCIDVKGNLWIALWGASKVICYSFKEEKIIREIVLPEAHVTCCAFGGKDLKELFITTSDSQHKTGGLYSIYIEDSCGFIEVSDSDLLVFH